MGDDLTDSEYEITRDESHDWYIKGDVKYPPVTKVLNFLDEDETGLNIWRDRNDGEGDSAHHEHLLWYARNRGTLAHYEALNPLADRDLWGADESKAMSEVLTGPPSDEWENASDDMSDIVYSILVNHYQRYISTRVQYADDTDLIDVLLDDLEYFVDEFDELRSKLGITEDSVIAVEQYVVSDEHQYGGQADLIYEDHDGNVVLADLKTSGSFRETHRLQTVAYKHAAEELGIVDHVDRLEVIRISPTKEQVTAYSNWQPSFVDDDAEWFDADGWFVDEWGNFEYEDLDAMFATVQQLAHEANKALK